MITSAKQLKDRIVNLTKGLSGIQKSDKAQMLMRNYFMERLLERVSKSRYKDNFILKGGMLVASLTGLEARATKDIDTTITAFDLKTDNAKNVLDEIISIDLGDGITYEIIDYSNIMEDFDYPGLRFSIAVHFDRIRDTISLDMSTDDVITPEAINYSYKLMLEDRSIPFRTYNLETLLAEKLQTVAARGIANTRLRDFYDIYMLTKLKWDVIDFDTLRKAFYATSQKRGTLEMSGTVFETIDSFAASEDAEAAWNKFKRDNYFVGDLLWTDVLSTVRRFSQEVISEEAEETLSEDEEQSLIMS